jgi:putative ABC transport system permease protein
MPTGHRLALRIARREALRYKGRSILSITLLGLPLLGVAIAASAYDTTTLSPEETADLYLGSNDAYIEFAIPGTPIEQMNWDSRWITSEIAAEGGSESDPGRAVRDSEILAALPVGSWIAPYSLESEGTILQAESPAGLAQIQGYGYQLGEGLYEDAGLEYVEGEVPGRGEAVINEAAADLLGIGVGDDLVLDGGATDELEVSGIVEIPWNLKEPFVIADSLPYTATGWLLDTPEPLTKEQALALNELGLTVWAGSLLDEPPAPGYVESSDSVARDEFMIYGLILVAVLMEVILLAGPAFAISARRRVREFALMSANGATPAQIRNTVLAGGLLFGLVAAVAAMALGAGIVAAGLPWIEQAVGYRSAGLRVMPSLQAVLIAVAIGTGLLSALAAGISASRANVVAALTGRTPRHQSSKRWLAVGLGMVATGIVAGIGGVALWSLPLMGLAIVLAQLGLVVCTPALLSLTAKLGRWLPLSPRMALREAGRNRGSAAPAIAAVLGVVAGGMAFSMIITAQAVRYEESEERTLPQGAMTLAISNHSGADTAIDWDAAVAEVEPQLRSRLGELELTHLPAYSGWGGCGAVTPAPNTDAECTWSPTRPEEHRCPYWDADNSTEADERAAVEAARDDPRCDETVDELWSHVTSIVASTDPEVVAAYTDLEGDELDRAIAVLEEGGVLVADKWALTEAETVVLQQKITIWDENGGMTEPQETFLELPAMAVEKGQLGFGRLFLSPAAAEAMGLQLSPWDQEYLVTTAAEPEDEDLEALAADLNREVADGDAWATFTVVDYTDPFIDVLVIAVTGLCALIALGATAVSTGLIVAEQRRDIATLGAVGAAPGLRKRFAMWQTMVIAAFGAGLGTVAAFVGYALIREALNRPLQYEYPYAVLYGWQLPWASFAIMLLAVPVVAALGALVFTRATLPSERRTT